MHLEEQDCLYLAWLLLPSKRRHLREIHLAAEMALHLDHIMYCQICHNLTLVETAIHVANGVSYD
jgi:hypothetical protein